MEFHYLWLVYLLPLALIILFYLFNRDHKSRVAESHYREVVDAGLTEPPSLHPLIDPSVCIGCAACVKACPEGKILALIQKKAVLIEPTHCIGHGACAKACPAQAIKLVFGTEKRGVDIPFVGADFQTNVPGIYIAGELGGMGLIRNAIEQGKQAIDSIVKNHSHSNKYDFDVIIIGAGPAGFAASLAAKKYGLRFKTIEQEDLGGTVAHYPRGKLVMTKPVELPIIGKTKIKDPTKEHLLSFWQSVEKRAGLEINYGERVSDIESDQDGFTVIATGKRYITQTVLLAIGRRGTPRKLNVPGEQLSKVVYRMVDPEQYQGQKVLVVGGGDSALEAAAEIAEQPGTRVILSYRKEAFSRARQRNRERVAQLAKEKKLLIAFCSSVHSITPDSIILKHENKLKKADNDAVIVCAGGILPSAFLKSIGVEVETKYGTA